MWNSNIGEEAVLFKRLINIILNWQKW